MTITFTRNAAISIKQTIEFKKEHGTIEAARKWRKQIFDKINYLQNFPQMGKKDERFTDYKYEIRYLIEENHRIYYEYTGDAIFILNMVDSRRDIEETKLF